LPGTIRDLRPAGCAPCPKLGQLSQFTSSVLGGPSRGSCRLRLADILQESHHKLALIGTATGPLALSNLDVLSVMASFHAPSRDTFRRSIRCESIGSAARHWRFVDLVSYAPTACTEAALGQPWAGSGRFICTARNSPPERALEYTLLYEQAGFAVLIQSCTVLRVYRALPPFDVSFSDSHASRSRQQIVVH
jgi:hypothetical protein